MALLVIMYHRARAERHGNAPEMLDAHFAALAQRGRVVLPTERCTPGQLNVCLTFDDAYYDFLAIVLPLLEKHRLRAVLAVPAGCILDSTASDAATRLNVAAADAFLPENHHAFCTWPELQRVVESGSVEIAAHGFNHLRLDDPNADLTQEIDESGAQLRQRLGCDVSSFVFPYGRYSRAALSRTMASYQTVFRIGGAVNRDWHHSPIYRVTLTSPDALIRPARLLACRARYFWNRIRGR